jgi:hypothetical protein
MNNRHELTGNPLLAQNVMNAVTRYGEKIGSDMGHASIQTTERYLGVSQVLTDAPCDHLRHQVKGLRGRRYRPSKVNNRRMKNTARFQLNAEVGKTSTRRPVGFGKSSEGAFTTTKYKYAKAPGVIGTELVTLNDHHRSNSPFPGFTGKV